MCTKPFLYQEQKLQRLCLGQECQCMAGKNWITNSRTEQLFHFFFKYLCSFIITPSSGLCYLQRETRPDTDVSQTYGGDLQTTHLIRWKKNFHTNVKTSSVNAGTGIWPPPPPACWHSCSLQGEGEVLCSWGRFHDLHSHRGRSPEEFS